MKKHRTLRISLADYNKRLALTIFVFVLFIAPIEISLHIIEPHSSPYRITLLTPLLDTRYAPVLEKLDDFHTMNTGQNYNCLLVGSSLAEYLDPALIAEQMHQQTGQNVNCYNFALMDASASSVATLLSLLVEEYEFDIVVWGTQAHHFFSEPNSNEDRFSKSSWIRYVQGDFNVQGWLYEYSYFFRALNIYLPLIYFPDSLDDPTAFVRSERDQQLVKSPRVNGYSAILGYKDSAPVFDPTDEGIIDYLPSLEESSAADWDAITKAAQLARDYNFALVMVEFPVATFTPEAKELMDEVTIYTRQRGIPVLSAGEVQLPTTAYCDTVSSTQYGFIHNHFHVSGTILFSTWLGNQIGQAIATGALDNVNDSFWNPGTQVLEPRYTETLGLSDEHYEAYLQFRNTFDLLSPNTTVLNPSPAALDRVYLQSSLGLLLEWQEETPADAWRSAFELMVLFDRMDYLADMEITEPEQRVLDNWYRSANPAQLKSLGVDYLLCRVEPGVSAVAHCPASVATHPGYTLIAHWDYAPLYEQYMLYRVGK